MIPGMYSEYLVFYDLPSLPEVPVRVPSVLMYGHQPASILCVQEVVPRMTSTWYHKDCNYCTILVPFNLLYETFLLSLVGIEEFHC